ncbi:MAG: ABC transporter permease [Clostridia bacterium]|nr:ABC transporter permease [Clostridia bacterium]
MKKQSEAQGYSFFQKHSQLLIPVTILALLLLFNLLRDSSYFNIAIRFNNDNNPVLAGNLISTIVDASELVILSIGMTLVTAACGGQDISVGALGTIAATMFAKVLYLFDEIGVAQILVALLATCGVTVLFSLFNGTLVAVFKIQPMIATLILFTCGRSIAYWIGQIANLFIPENPITPIIGTVIPGFPVPTPVLIVAVVGILFALVFKFTNLRLYTQTVGINQGAARLNGINCVAIKLISFAILGVCCAIAGVINVCRIGGKVTYNSLMVDFEMKAILAVAIGGNSLGGGKFRIIGSVLGAYAYCLLFNTLIAMKVPSTHITAYQAVVIFLLVIFSSDQVKETIAKFWKTWIVGKFRSKTTGTDISSGKEA